ncbi:Uncharacterised protein [Streptococcus pneumoniae]|nr:Uncharacterised protein [Streptococcus pneumoniae]
MWVLGFILFMIFFYSNNSKKIKKLENKIKNESSIMKLATLP